MESEAAQGRGGAGSWWMLGLLFALYLFSQVDRQIVSLLVAPIKADLGLSDFEMSFILGPAFAVFYAVFGIPLGWLADRYPRRWVVAAGATLWSCATMAGGLARSFHALFAARVGVGVGEASLVPSAYSLIADAFPRERLTLATSIFQSAGTVGLAVAFALGGLAIGVADHFAGTVWPLIGMLRPWQTVMILVALPALVLGLLLLTVSEPARRGLRPAAAGAGDDPAFFAFLRERRAVVLPMLIGFGSISLCGYTMVAWGPAYIGRRFGLSPADYGPALGAVNLCAALSIIVLGRFVDRLLVAGHRDIHLRLYGGMTLVAIPVGVAIFLMPAPIGYYLLYALLLIATAPSLVFVSSIFALLAPSSLRARLVALFLFIYTVIGLGIGPVVVGAMTDYVFRDETRLGASLACVVVAGFASGTIFLRIALKAFRRIAP